MKKIKYNLIIIFITALAAAFILRDLTTSKFAVIKETQAVDSAPTLAPQSEEGYISADINNSEPTKSDGKININTAGTAELETLDGIGEGLAQRIIDYRTEKGNFEVIQDIMKVNGIGTKRFDAIKEYITVN